MKGIRLVKKSGGQFLAAYQSDQDRLKSIKNDTLVFADIKQPRNPDNHARFFALLKFCFDYWNPHIEKWEGAESVKTMDCFREKILCLAGHHMTVVFKDGSVGIRAKSVSFDMLDDEEEFSNLYKAVFDVLWKFVMSKVEGLDCNQIEGLISQMSSYE